MIKKLCFFLSTVIFAGTLTPVMAAEKEPTITDSYKTEILMDLGMINKDAYSGNTISRMDFLKSICAAISENVPDGKDLINMGKEYDITVAEGISDFKGNAAVTYDEAIKMTISACGYDSAAQFSGGFPKGYRDMATRLDIGVKGINPSETITPDIAIEILFDMIQAPSLTLSGVQNNSGIYDEGETILKKRDILWVEGVVSGNADTLLNNATGGGRNAVYIDEKKYTSLLVKAQNYLGYSVIACIDVDDNIVAIAKKEKTNKEYEVRGKDICRSENGMSTVYYLNDREKEKKLKISPIVDVIHNGYALPDYNENDLKPNVGNVVFIDNNGDDIIDVIKITEKQLIVVDYVSVKSKVVYNKLNNAVIPQLNLEGTNIEYEFLCGNDSIRLPGLQKYDILEVAVPRNKTDDYKITGTVSREIVTGKLNGIDSDEGTITVNVGEEQQEIECNRDFTKMQLERKLNVGSEIVIHLDSMGNAAYVESISGEKYVFATKVLSSDEIYSLRYIGEDGEWHDTDFADKLNYNYMSKKQSEAVYGLLGGEQFKRKLLRIKINSEGKITSILEQGIDRTEESKFVLSKQVNEMWTTNNNSFLWKGYLTDDAIVFIVPESETASRDDYACGGRNILNSGTTYTAELYNIDDFETTDLAVVYGNADATPTGYDWFIVTKKIVTINQDDEPAIRLVSKFGNDETNTVVEGKQNLFGDVEVGDVLIFSRDSKGKVTSKKIVHDLSKGPVAANNNGIFHNDKIVMKGTVEKVDPATGMLRVNYNGSITAIPVPQATQILFYDKQENEIKYVTVGDLISGDYVLSVYDYGNFKKMAVIRY